MDIKKRIEHWTKLINETKIKMNAYVFIKELIEEEITNCQANMEHYLQEIIDIEKNNHANQ